MQKKTVKGFVLGFSTAIILGSATLSVGAASGQFKDVKAGAWYENAVLWAQEKGIVNGYPDGTFKPNSNVTRAELTGVVQNLAKEGYIDADILLEEYLDGYDKYEAIQVGKTTFKDLENIFGGYTPGSNYGEFYVFAGDIAITVTGDGNTVASKWVSERNIPESLKKRYPQVTEQNLKKLEEGMSYELVSAILGGKGLLDFENTDHKYYVWYNMEGIGEPLAFKKIGDGLSLDPLYSAALDRLSSEISPAENN